MSDQPEVRHDTIRTPERVPPVHVHALAMQKAQRKSRRRVVIDLQLGDSRSVEGDDREWSFSYRLGPPSGRSS